MERAGRPEAGTVLIVDDDLNDIGLTQRAIAAVCPRLGIRGVRSGEELICYPQGENRFSDRAEFPYPILVLLDLKMSGMHGFDVLSWLGNHPPHNLIPVVVLTVSGEVQVAQRAYELGARSFLTKPLTANEFRNTMDKFEGGPATYKVFEPG
jgi:CheY-like chemotaxis protein